MHHNFPAQDGLPIALAVLVSLEQNEPSIPANIQDLVDTLNIWLIAATLLGLIWGCARFARLPMTGSWFRWKLGCYTVIMILDFWAVYRLYKGDPVWLAVRLMLARITINWEVWYCYHYQFWRERRRIRESEAA